MNRLRQFAGAAALWLAPLAAIGAQAQKSPEAPGDIEAHFFTPPGFSRPGKPVIAPSELNL